MPAHAPTPAGGAEGIDSDRQDRDARPEYPAHVVRVRGGDHVSALAHAHGNASVDRAGAGGAAAELAGGSARGASSG